MGSQSKVIDNLYSTNLSLSCPFTRPVLNSSSLNQTGQCADLTISYHGT